MAAKKEETTIEQELVKIQKALKAPKGKTNSFGRYKYRSCGDILEALKPLLPDDIVCTITDDVEEIGGRVYVKAIVTFGTSEKRISTHGWAREALTKKGMDESQITGTASSYARKVALGGLFLIDETEDADATNKHGKEEAASPPKAKAKAKEMDVWEHCRAAYVKSKEDFNQAMNDCGFLNMGEVKECKDPEGRAQEILDNFNKM